MKVDEMRLIVRDMYPGKGWKYRVMNMMHDNQIIAIYQSKLYPKPKKETSRRSTKPKQMSLFDCPDFVNANKHILER